MEIHRTRKFPAKDTHRFVEQNDLTSFDADLFKISLSFLKLFSIGIAPERQSYLWQIIAYILRTSLCIIIFSYALSRTLYFLSLLSYSGVARLFTLDGLNDAAHIVTGLLLISQSFSTIRLDEYIYGILGSNGLRGSFRSIVRKGIFWLFLLTTVATSSLEVLVYSDMNIPLPPPALRYVSTTESSLTTEWHYYGTDTSDLAKSGRGRPWSSNDYNFVEPSLQVSDKLNRALDHLNQPAEGNLLDLTVMNELATGQRKNDYGVSRFGLQHNPFRDPVGSPPAVNDKNGVDKDSAENSDDESGESVESDNKSNKQKVSTQRLPSAKAPTSTSNEDDSGEEVSDGDNGSSEGLSSSKVITAKVGGVTPRRIESGSNKNIDNSNEDDEEKHGKEEDNRENSEETAGDELKDEDDDEDQKDEQIKAEPEDQNNSEEEFDSTERKRRRKRELVVVTEEEVKNTISYRLLQILRRRGNVAHFTRCFILKNFVLLSAAFVGAFCWTLQGRLRSLNGHLYSGLIVETTRVEGNINLEKELTETKYIFLHIIILQGIMNRLFRHFALAWQAVVLTETQFLIRLFLELPSVPVKTSLTVPPLKIFAAVHLMTLLIIHIFLTEGSQRLRKQFIVTVQFISIGTALHPSGSSPAVLEQASELISLGIASPAGLNFPGMKSYSRGIGLATFLIAIFIANYSFTSESYVLQP